MESRALAVVLMFAAACGGMESSLRPRAAFDLKCPADQLVLTQLSPECGGFMCTLGVSGCGQQVTYVWDHVASAWVMNNATTPPSAATPASQPAAK
jgi:hypothetical protein